MKQNSVFILLIILNLNLYAQQMLTNTGFEGSYTNIADNWYEISWGDSVMPDTDWFRETEIVHSDNSAQKAVINQTGDGAIMLIQPIDFEAGEVYEDSVWLRSDTPMKVALILQEREPYYYIPTIYIASIGNEWEQLNIIGSFSQGSNNQQVIEGRFVIQPMETGILYIDDASLIINTENLLNGPVANTDTIPTTYFGMHANRLGIHQTYPPVNMGIMRLWDTGTEWQIIEPWDGAIHDPNNWIYDSIGNSGYGFRMDYYVNYIKTNNPTADIIYTMGQTPAWSANENTLPPENIADWTD